MECPNCKHVSDDSSLLKCSECGDAFERGHLEELGHLEYMQQWIEDNVLSDAYEVRVIKKKIQERHEEFLKKITREHVLEEETPVVPEISSESEIAPIDTLEPVSILETAAPSVAEVKVEPVIPAPPEPAPPPKKIVPPKPKRPPVDWKKFRARIAEAATSGALLRALLYLSAFMIVISATVLVVRFWNEFDPLLQLVFIAAVPISFYIGGWILRTRLKLAQAGSVLTGIGAVLVAVDFAAIYQFGGLAERVDGPIYWLVVAVFCTALYSFTAWRVQGEFFDYLTLIGGGSILFTLTRIPPLPIEWSVVSVTISAIFMMILASRFWQAGEKRHEFARASRYLSQILLPISLVYIIFSPSQPPVGQMVAFLVATIGYSILAWQFPSLLFAYAALGTSIGTVVFGLLVFKTPLEWYPVAASVLALAYIFIGHIMKRVGSKSDITQKYPKALKTTGLILIGLTILGGHTVAFIKIWPAVIALTLASLNLAFCAFFFQQSRYTLLSSGLFIIPFLLAFGRWFTDQNVSQLIGWITVAWSSLSLVYIGAGALLRNVDQHARWLYAVGHFSAFASFIILPFDFIIISDNWKNTPSLSTLGICFAVYTVSFILQDSGKYLSLSKISKWLPYGLGKSIFLWPLGIILPIWVSVAWYGSELSRPWLGGTLTGVGLAYLVIGQLLSKRVKEYRFPLHAIVYLLCAIGILLAISTNYALLTSLLVTALSLVILAYLYNRVIETTIVSLLIIWPFALLLEIIKIETYSHALGYVLLASIAYIPIAIFLNKSKMYSKRYHHIPVFIVGYGLAVYAIAVSILGRGTDTFIPWVAVLIPLIATILFTFSTSYFKTIKYSIGWAWASTATLAIAFGQCLTLFKVPVRYDALAWVGLATVYMGLERALSFVTEKEMLPKSWFKQFHSPLVSGTFLLAALGLSLSIPDTFSAFSGYQLDDYLAHILAQSLLLILTVVFAWAHRKSWLLYIEPFLSFLPTTLFFIGYGERIFGQPLTTPQYALGWTGLGTIHFLVAAVLDRAKIRYANGVYFGAYALLTWAVLWSIIDRATLIWTLGLWILISIGSATLIHLGKHKTWEEFVQLIFGQSKSILRTIVQNLFIWLAAFTFPIWCVLFLLQLNIQQGFTWLGLVAPPIIYLGLTQWLRRINKTYPLPLHISAQFYTAAGILISAPVTIRYLFTSYSPDDTSALVGFGTLQIIAVLFYAASAWTIKTRIFAYIPAWLSIVPFTILWKLFGPTFTPLPLVIPWLIWASILLVIGFWLDKNKIRYSHGPYLAGYILAIFALASSISDRLSNIYALALTIFLGTISFLVVHFGRHKSFEDLVNTFFKKANVTTQRLIATVFLFFATYAFPVLLTQFLAQIKYTLPWRGVALALTAPTYIAIGLAVHKSKSRSISTAPTWALYSAGYILTAIGAMISFGDERLAIYVLTLNAVVYAVSAYIFRQAFWLYLSNVLAPIIALLVLHHTENLNSVNVAWIFTGFAFAYLALGQVFDRSKKAKESDSIHSFAAPFYMPGFMLSAVALAISSSDKMLALQIYSVAVIFYALCSWLFRESLFLYPASWLAAVPYYLAITLTSLETRWYGLAWLPLILIYIGIGRFVFHKRPLALLGKGVLLQWLSHPAVPFYLLAYSLSVSMIAISYISPLSLTLAFAVGATLYFATAFLFGTPAWLYAGLFSVHMTILAYFTIDPQGGSAHNIPIPFLGLTWLISLIGFSFSRWGKQAGSRSKNDASSQSLIMKLFGDPWSRPFFAFAIFDIFVWQSIALRDHNTTITLASGFAILLAIFSLLWMEHLLVYGVVGFGMLALGARMHQAQFALPDSMVIYSGIGFGLYLFGILLKLISNRIKVLTVWLHPLTHSAVFLTAVAAAVNLPFVVKNMTATAATLAFAGALYVAIAYRGRRYILGYLGMALLEAAWVMLLYMNDVLQPQWYAIPGGLYFIGMGFLEWSRNRKGYAVAIELLGLGILLVTSFTQSLNGAQGFPYFVLLMIESLLVIWWGVLQRRKIPFFTGIGASVLNIIAQVTVLVNVYNVNIWLVGLGVGLLIMGIAVWVELKREQLRTRARELTETLEKWE